MTELILNCSLELSVERNQLSSLPVEIGQLSQLRTLSVAHNSLTSIPQEIGNLVSLEAVSFSCNQINTFPSQIFGLSSLRLLLLHDNALHTIPPEIGALKRLERLDLSKNLIEALPAQMGQLASLEWLSLFHNHLPSLPPSVGELSSLRHLAVQDNPLTWLPPEMGLLSSLEFLNIPNVVWSLPFELSLLSIYNLPIPQSCLPLEGETPPALHHNPTPNTLTDICAQVVGEALKAKTRKQERSLIERLKVPLELQERLLTNGAKRCGGCLKKLYGGPKFKGVLFRRCLGELSKIRLDVSFCSYRCKQSAGVND